MYKSLQEVKTALDEGVELNMIIKYDDVEVYDVDENIVYTTKVFSLLWDSLDLLDIPYVAVK